MLRISLLGEQLISDDADGVVRTRSSRTAALVALLVMHAGAPQTRGRIAGLFWPDSSDAQALTNLRRELHNLRHALRDDPSLQVTPTTLCWRDTDTCWVDLRAFQIAYETAMAARAGGDGDAALRHATTAIGLYRGALLPGGYEDWLLEARSELESRCVALCDLICRTRVRHGDLLGAVAIGRRRVQLRPLEEVGYRTLMELQADLGDRAGAVSTYHHCASVLERELGIEPDQRTRRTLERVLADTDPAGPGRAETAPASIEETPRPGRASAMLVARSRELGRLRRLWRAVAGGHPALALIEGDAGVGKSRLLMEIARVARSHGAVVASTQCFGGSGRLALAPVADWLRSPVIQSAVAALDPLWRAEVTRLVPSGTRPGAPGLGPMAGPWQRHRFFEGLARALINAKRPTLLTLDDLQWCDQETLDFLAFCLRLTDDTPLLVAATLGTDSPGSPAAPGNEAELSGWIARMRATGLLSVLNLDPLEIGDTARLAEAIAGRRLTEDDARLLQATTGGFPLYIVETVRGTADGGRLRGAEDAGPLRDAATAANTARPSVPIGDVAAVLRRRLDHATPAAQQVARLAAAVGRNFTLNLLTEASDLDPATVVRAVDELWRRRIVREFRDGYDFAHDLLREAAYAQVSPPERWLLHRRLAQGLELVHAEDTDAVSAQLAGQYALAGRGERAVAYYRRAADIASARFAHAEAIRLHRSALSIVRGLPAGRARDRHELAILEALAGPLNARYGYSSAQLRETLERCIALGESLGRADATRTALLGLWASLFGLGRTIAAHRTAARALALGERDGQHSAAAHFAFGGSAMSLGRPAEALRHFARLAAPAQDVQPLSIGTRPDVHGQAWAAHAHWLLGHDEEAVRCSREAIACARGLDHPYSLTVALAYAGVTHQLRQEPAAVRDVAGELRELCQRYGFAYYREWGLVLDGWSRSGRWGLALARRGIAQLKAGDAIARMPYWLSLLADLAARNGRPDAARAALDAALVGGKARDDLWWLPEVMRLRAAYDDPRAAGARLRRAAAMAREHGSVALLRRCERDLAALAA